MDELVPNPLSHGNPELAHGNGAVGRYSTFFYQDLM